MAMIKNFPDLRAGQPARDEANRIFEMTRVFPKEEKLSPTAQIRRSSRAMKSMIAEAWGHRRYPASIVSKLTDAVGEANGNEARLDDALDCGYLQPSQSQVFDSAWQFIGGRIANMIVKAGDFCTTTH